MGEFKHNPFSQRRFRDLELTFSFSVRFVLRFVPSAQRDSNTPRIINSTVFSSTCDLGKQLFLDLCSSRVRRLRRIKLVSSLRLFPFDASSPFLTLLLLPPHRNPPYLLHRPPLPLLPSLHADLLLAPVPPPVQPRRRDVVGTRRGFEAGHRVVGQERSCFGHYVPRFVCYYFGGACAGEFQL